jgi:hypothetical protein
VRLASVASRQAALIFDRLFGPVEQFVTAAVILGLGEPSYRRDIWTALNFQHLRLDRHYLI